MSGAHTNENDIRTETGPNNNENSIGIEKTKTSTTIIK